MRPERNWRAAGNQRRTGNVSGQGTQNHTGFGNKARRGLKRNGDRVRLRLTSGNAESDSDADRW